MLETVQISTFAPDLRFEQKFSIDDVSAPLISSSIHLHWATFSKIFYPRYVNNIYFDTESLACYRDNVEGVPNRLKIRIRWYGNVPVDPMEPLPSPMLEIKIRKNAYGRKLQYPLDSVTLSSIGTHEFFLRLLEKAEVPLILRGQFQPFRPVLINRYRRIYYLSHNKAIRLTLDNELRYLQYNKRGGAVLPSFDERYHSVLELKYDPKDDAMARRVSSAFRFRHTKSSKYVNGMGRLLAYAA